MSSFFSSLANKAQSAYEQSPISAQVNQLQSKLNHGSEGTQNSPAQGNQTTGLRGNIVHQFRNLQLQYASVDPVQRILTSQKGVSLDFESVSKDAKSQSKELYMWGQAAHGEDINDVTDRLAYLNFIHGSLALTLGNELNTSRVAFKTLRDAERALEPRRKEKASLQNQIGVLEHEQKKKYEKQLEALRDQLEKMEKEDAKSEAEIHVLKRKAVAETERAKWAALREYGEKLVLLAESSGPIISALPQDLPTEAQPYKGKEVTAQTRATLQHMLDNYRPGSIGHAFQPHAEDLDRADSRSFGVTHAAELSGIESPALRGQGKSSMEQSTSTMHNMPPPPTHPSTTHSNTGAAHTTSPPSSFQGPGTATSPPINPAALNTTPTMLPPKQPSIGNNTSSSPDAVPIPAKVDAHPSTVSHASNGSMPSPEMGTAPIQVPEPTLAETGTPITGHGDGPASGSLKDLKSPGAKTTFSPSGAPPMPVPASLKPGMASTSTATAAPAMPGAAPGTTSFPSAEEEKARLRREVESENKPKSAEEEKKELEQRERDRLVQEMAAQQAGKADDTMPPAYQDNM